MIMFLATPMVNLAASVPIEQFLINALPGLVIIPHLKIRNILMQQLLLSKHAQKCWSNGATVFFSEKYFKCWETSCHGVHRLYTTTAHYPYLSLKCH